MSKHSGIKNLTIWCEFTKYYTVFATKPPHGKEKIADIGGIRTRSTGKDASNPFVWSGVKKSRWRRQNEGGSRWSRATAINLTVLGKRKVEK